MDIATDPNPDAKTVKRNCLIAIAAVMALSGLLLGLLDEDSPYANIVDLLVMILTPLLVVAWAFSDALEWNYTITLRLSVLMFLLLFIGFPYYLFRTRPRRNAFHALGRAVLFSIAAYGIHAVVYLLGCAIYNMT